MENASAGATAALSIYIQPRLVTVALAALWACTGAAYGCVLPFLAVYASQRGVSLTGVGVLSALGSGAAALAQPTVGRALDRTGRHRLILGMAAGLGACGFAVLGHVAAAPLLALCAALGSAGFYGMRVIMSAATLGAVERSGRGSAAFARYRLFASVGYTATSAVGGFVLSHTSFAVLFSLGALLFGTAVLCGLAVNYTAGGQDRPLSAPTEEAAPAISGRRVLLTLMLMALLFGTITSSADTYVSLLMRSLHGSLAQVGLTATIPALVEIPLMAVAGGLADRLPRAPLLALGMSVLPLRFALYAVVGAPLPLLGIQMLDGFTFTVYAIIGVAVLAGETPREERAWSLGLYSSAATIGPIVGPLLAGVLASRVGLHAMFGAFALAAVAVPTVVAVGLWPLIKRSVVSHQQSA